MTEAEKGEPRNKYCERSVLDDEASVEQFFAQRLIEDLGYKDHEIRPKTALSDIVVARGRRRENYRPDRVIVCRGKPRWILDAKATTETVDEWAYQGAGYALGLNQGFSDDDPCQYYVITNGLILKVWKWNDAMPCQSLRFADFVDGNPNYLRLRTILDAGIVRKGWMAANRQWESAQVVLNKPAVEDVKRLFKNCHRLIWKAEKMNPQPAFFEFVKIMFVKLWEDKKLLDDPELGPLVLAGQPIPRERIPFSSHWIERMEAEGVDNPIDSVMFAHLMKVLREAVAAGQKKPIFPEAEGIRLHPGTIKEVVKRLESYNMFGVDEDLNGRLFETFLSATMRGKDLGQFFTPRSVVRLMERLAAPQAGRGRVERVLDACCGTGGFLIEALADMRNQVVSNTSLSAREREELFEEISNEALCGIDAGQDPPIARIARINMYLHGDGGSRIYAADSLDKRVQTAVGTDDQARRELDELRAVLGGKFHVVLTNPPFSMGYSSKIPAEALLLEQYDLSSYGHDGTAHRRPSLASRVMFIERYADLLAPGGRFLTVIDDATLSTPKYRYARDFIRERFIVRAVISLPGDAFQRVGARAKTSILYLKKRHPQETGQPDLFMAEALYIGLDDVPPKTPASRADEARRLAEGEIATILEGFGEFLAGKQGPWIAPGEAIQDRLDVKSCLPRGRDTATDWQARGYEVLPLGSIVDHIAGECVTPQETPEARFVFLRVRYDGVPEEGESRLGREITYSSVQRACGGDLVVSNIAMVLGAICVLPSGLEHAVVSSEFTVMRVKDERFLPWFLWGYLRSPEVRARLLSDATGISRHRVSWDLLSRTPVPFIGDSAQKEIADEYERAHKALRDAEKKWKETDKRLYTGLDLDNPWARKRLLAAKPPK